MSWDFKGTLHFYIGTGKQGRLIRADYIKILEEVVAPEWDENLIFREDNNGPYRTKGQADNKVKQAKRRLGIKWEAQPSNSPDLNPIETL
jgi:transposase